MADFEACLAMDRDPEVTRYIRGPWTDPGAHAAFVKDRIEADFGPGLGYWSIFLKAQPDRLAGWILLIPCDGVGPEVEVGWRLNRWAWGAGYAPEAARVIVAHGFRTLGLARVVADIAPGNRASLRVAEKIGMAFTGDGWHGGDPCKHYVMTAETFMARAPVDDRAEDRTQGRAAD